MTDTHSSRPGGGTSHTAYGTEPVRTGWTGWVAFASTMMLLLGSFQAVQGLVAIFDDGYYHVTPSGLVVNVDYTAWGWTHPWRCRRPGTGAGSARVLKSAARLHSAGTRSVVRGLSQIA
jgi:hypothetical protein